MNRCIHIISSRTKTLEKSLESFYKCFNCKYDYPVFIYHFDNIYSESFKSDIHNSISKNIHFIEIDYELPKNLKRSEIFFAKNPSRIGYLHMCNFWSNYYHHPKTMYHNYDYAFNFDDDSLWIKELDYDPFERLANSNSVMLSFNCYRYPVNHRSRSVRVGLCKLVVDYCKKYQITPKHKYLQQLLQITNVKKAEDFFQTNLVCYDTNIAKLEIFKTAEYKNWIGIVNNSNGIYKYRWGDNEIISLFHNLHYSTPVLLIEKEKQQAGGKNEYIDPGGLRYITDFAPGVKFPFK